MKCVANLNHTNDKKLSVWWDQCNSVHLWQQFIIINTFVIFSISEQNLNRILLAKSKIKRVCRRTTGPVAVMTGRQGQVNSVVDTDTTVRHDHQEERRTTISTLIQLFLLHSIFIFFSYLPDQENTFYNMLSIFDFFCAQPSSYKIPRKFS